MDCAKRQVGVEYGLSISVVNVVLLKSYENMPVSLCLLLDLIAKAAESKSQHLSADPDNLTEQKTGCA